MINRTAPRGKKKFDLKRLGKIPTNRRAPQNERTTPVRREKKRMKENQGGKLSARIPVDQGGKRTAIKGKAVRCSIEEQESVDRNALKLSLERRIHRARKKEARALRFGEK